MMVVAWMPRNKSQSCTAVDPSGRLQAIGLRGKTNPPTTPANGAQWGDQPWAHGVAEGDQHRGLGQAHRPRRRCRRLPPRLLARGQRLASAAARSTGRRGPARASSREVGVRKSPLASGPSLVLATGSLGAQLFWRGRPDGTSASCVGAAGIVPVYRARSRYMRTSRIWICHMGEIKRTWRAGVIAVVPPRRVPGHLGPPRGGVVRAPKDVAKGLFSGALEKLEAIKAEQAAHVARLTKKKRKGVSGEGVAAGSVAGATQDSTTASQDPKAKDRDKSVGFADSAPPSARSAGGHVLVPHRVVGAIVNIPGGDALYVASAYLHHSQGLSDLNLRLLSHVAAALEAPQMYWALVLEQDRKPPVRQPLCYAIKWLSLKFRMYVSLLDAPGPDAVRQDWLIISGGIMKFVLQYRALTAPTCTGLFVLSSMLLWLLLKPSPSRKL
ncbi:unnamed protein product [Prorocentrum cordatum]|uniref:Uncharacterized protein n=1 Tax=Prorocentrum cordatum TaxID=2364126 RepID=A0ABN9PGS6_9DINO|nr:unnamed protein product [Polarella glacialis]